MLDAAWEKRVQGQVSVSPVAEAICSHHHNHVMGAKWVLTWACDSLVTANFVPRRMQCVATLFLSLAFTWTQMAAPWINLWRTRDKRQDFWVTFLVYRSSVFSQQIELSKVPTLSASLSFHSIATELLWNLSCLFNISNTQIKQMCKGGLPAARSSYLKSIRLRFKSPLGFQLHNFMTARHDVIKVINPTII